MKKIALLLITALVAASINAQEVKKSLGKKSFKPQHEDATYLKGSVPVVDGKVTFTEIIEVAGKSKEQIYQSVAQWATLRFERETRRGEWDEPDFFKNNEYAKVTVADKTNCTIGCQGAEEIVFKNQTLQKDFANIYYTVKVDITDNKAVLTVRNIYYIYTGGIGEKMNAEDYITDETAFNRKGTLHKQLAKFRVRTIDLVKELAKEIKESASK